jgi:hypothetical protein
MYVDMTDVAVNASAARGTSEGGGVELGRTCSPAVGYSFAAGTTDGAGAFDFTQGTTSGNPFWDAIAHTVRGARCCLRDVSVRRGVRRAEGLRDFCKAAGLAAAKGGV